MLVLSAKSQMELVDMKEILQCIEVALEEFSSSATDTPIRTILPFGTENSGVVMPSVAENLQAMGLKYVNVVPSNINISKKVINGVVLLSDMTTGEPLALLEGSYLTQLRTGALSGVATKYLAREDSKTLGIIGTGEQAKGLCEAILAVREIETIYVHNRTEKKALAFSEFVSKKFNKKVIICHDPNEVVKEADILVTATTSMQPVFTEPLRPGVHVNGVGSFKPTMQELPTSAICDAAKVVVESKEAALEEAGDLVVPIEAGMYSYDAIHGELGQIISGNLSGRETDQEVTIFKSVGLAIADIVIAKYFYDKACQHKVGVTVDLT
ncbi:ornithine cyclodeaminase family protein [Sporosarcina sp. BI001-red]|uniref:ornithine cyclodeaminase family protein n=1 Tax=Sporosarcina sp. BI001-red TaxID=2282866 RepID=UPI000E286561|nr:ornithine cyclodeaminase family protein [Sporosarcina sp. BI001-red]REB07096.1 ornithine cyclodeaminase family protein [Sporosarcina sp. BI001-red]